MFNLILIKILSKFKFKCYYMDYSILKKNSYILKIGMNLLRNL